MNSSFLDIVARDLYIRYGKQMSELCLIFPNRRARLFFAKSLSRIISEPLWQPAYSTMDDFVKQAVDLQAADNFPLLLTLYESYKSVRQTDEPFDRFYYWGSMMLYDFDTLDKYRVNAQALFTNLQHQKALEGDFSFLDEDQLAAIRRFWESFQPEGKSTLQQQFIEIWEILLPVYNDFRQRLMQQKIAYEGMIYRLLAEQLESNSIIARRNDEAIFNQATPSLQAKRSNLQLENTRYIFIGFNALNECEKTLFRYLQRQGRAEFYWDYDAYYLNDTQQEAGWFLRENMREFPSSLENADFSNFKDEKNINIIAAPSDAVQTKLVYNILSDMSAAADVTTAVVLADEQLLIPLLHTLPSAAPNINVTMGYPIRNSAFFSLLLLLLKLLRNAKSGSGNSQRFYYADLLAVLHHPYIKIIDNQNIEKELNNIVSFNNIYVSKYKYIENQYLVSLFEKPENFSQLTEKLINLLEEIERKAASYGNDIILSCYLQHGIRRLLILKKAMDESAVEISLPVYISVLQSHLQHETIPFTGEPLIGLQVLGLLETRCLDFENVVLLSANEGILPKSLNAPSFIPYNLRKGFGIPAIEQHEAVYAYYFYRLLQRAKRITLVYNTKTDEARSGEASRYLLQLKLESGHRVQEQSVAFDMGIDTPEEISVAKTPEIVTALADYFNVEKAKLFSPSALNTYIACPLQFYYKYVARIKEPEMVEDDINNQLLGKVLHASMERLYIPLIRKSLSINDLQLLLEDEWRLDEAVNQSIANVFFDADALPDDAMEDGKMLILKNVVKKYVRQVLQIDRHLIPFAVEDLECTIQQPVTFTVEGQERTITAGGIIDRMDRVGDTLRIVDYKTTTAGARKEKSTMPSLEALFDSEEKLQRKEMLQAVFYAVLLKQQQPAQNIKPLLYFLHDAFEENANFSLVDASSGLQIDDVADYVSPFMEALRHTLVKIFDNQTPFTQTKDEKICRYCPYKLLCNR